MTVSAVDDSSWNVAKISYELKFGDPQSLFRIGRRSGVIEVNKDGLDFETEWNYLLGVEARDDSTNKSVVVEVNITITDVNDNPPVFDPENYVKEVSEDVPNGTIILRVNASDRDSGVNDAWCFPSGQAMINSLSRSTARLVKWLRSNRWITRVSRNTSCR